MIGDPPVSVKVEGAILVQLHGRVGEAERGQHRALVARQDGLRGLKHLAANIEPQGLGWAAVLLCAWQAGCGRPAGSTHLLDLISSTVHGKPCYLTSLSSMAAQVYNRHACAFSNWMASASSRAFLLSSRRNARCRASCEARHTNTVNTST